jgi:hypothetical protein
MSNPLIYYYTDGACGTGKTYQALNKIAMAGGRHLFVVDRKETMLERQTTMTRIAIETGHYMQTLCVMSDDDRSTKRLGVRRRIHDLAEDYADHADVCVFITHEGMRMCDFAEFDSWSIWIDEVPDIMDNESIAIGVSRVLLDSLYTMLPILKEDGTPTGWSEIACRDVEVDLAMIAHDDIACGLRTLHRRIMEAKDTGRRSVIVNGSDWSEFVGDNKCNWFSIWSPMHVSMFQSVNFLANAFTDSLTFQIMRSMWPSIDWMEVKTNSTREFKPRDVTIHYYADSHVASRKLFGSDEGKDNLRKVCADINARIGDRDHIWMCNRSDAESVKLTGTKLTPRQAGSNEYARVTAATCIYSVKPDADQRKVYQLLGVDPNYYTETNERETILQFMCRTSIRDPENVADLNFYVYDKTQADYLLRYFRRDERGYANAVTVMHDLGFAKVERKAGRPVINRTPEEKRKMAAERKALSRAKLRKAA